MTSDDAARTARPYGTWPSAVGPDALTASVVDLSGVLLDGDDTYWLEARPEEGGRTVLVRLGAGGGPAAEAFRLPDGSGADVRSRVHEYGGAPYTVRDGVAVLSDATDGRLWAVRDGQARALTPAGGRRYADPEIDLARGLVYVVEENHDAAAPGRGGTPEPTNHLVAVPLDGSAAADPGAVTTVVADHDFVAAARLSADGGRLAWIAWDHPAMPWTSSVLYVGRLPDGASPAGAPAGAALEDVTRVAGGSGVGVAQPVWTPTGDLVHVDDSTGWWNLYRTDAGRLPGGDGSGHALRALHPAPMEFTAPPWRFGPRGVAVLDEDHLVCSWTQDGRWHLGTVRLANGELEEWGTGWDPAGDVAATGDRVVFVGAAPDRFPAVVRADLAAATTRVLRTSCDLELDPADVAHPEPLTWPTGDGGEAHGFFYPPTSATTTGPADAAPPLLVHTHGGPTSAASAVLSLGVQFWTTRGFAVLDVNYGGSTGFGRAYRERLDGRWGEVDVADVVAGARHLADLGRVDPRRMAVRGGSAGGFTTLAALAFTDVFTAGASRYGVGDLEALALHTHKFESRYTDSLVGPYPEAVELYRRRSPVHHAEDITAPVLLLQGTEDAVVPPAQAEAMAAALRAKGSPVAVVLLEGEGHGFRSSAAIRRAVLAELSFFGQVWGFTPAGDVPRVAVENLS